LHWRFLIFAGIVAKKQAFGVSMELFYAPGTVALASLIALHEADIAFTPNRLDFSQSEQRSEKYLRLNPKGRVPVLITDAGALTETPAILAYIAGLNPKKPLAPSDPFDFAKMQELNSYLASTVHVNHAHRVRGVRWAALQSSLDDMASKVTQNMQDCFALIQAEHFRGPWVMGDQFTVADAYLYTVGTWLKGDGVDIATLPGIAAHADAMRQRPAVQKALTY
jgi:glutathione S-transferase